MTSNNLNPQLYVITEFESTVLCEYNDGTKEMMKKSELKVCCHVKERIERLRTRSMNKK